MHSNVAGGTELQQRTSEQMVRYFTPTIKDMYVSVDFQNINIIVTIFCLTTYKQVLVQLNVRKEIKLVLQYFLNNI